MQITKKNTGKKEKSHKDCQTERNKSGKRIILNTTM